METLFSQQNYFSMRQNLKQREEELGAKLRDRLPSSEVGTALFEFLVIRKELLKEKLVKEPDLSAQGRAKELSELLELFMPAKGESE